MRIAQLSETTGVPIPSIKYYLREGLLHTGERTARNQAEYDDSHVRRLRLIRALIDAGGLSIAATRKLLVILDDDSLPIDLALGHAISAALKPPANTESPQMEWARSRVDALLDERDWLVERDTDKTEALASALAALSQLKSVGAEELLKLHLPHVEALAIEEIQWALKHEDKDSIVESAVGGTFLGGAIFNALRLLAHENLARRTAQPTEESE